MDETKIRLAKCFQIVFPHLSEVEIVTASQANTEAWDSLAAITLLNVIEEELNIAIDFEFLATLTSFDRIANYVHEIKNDRPREAHNVF